MRKNALFKEVLPELDLNGNCYESGITQYLYRRYNHRISAQRETMKPIIISYDCTDHDPIDKWIPDDSYDVDYWMKFTIGPGNEGGENFRVRVVTPNNLHSKASPKYAIILTEYSWLKVIVEVGALLDKCQDTNWAGIAEKLSQFMCREYENYRPYKGGLRVSSHIKSKHSDLV